MYFTDFMKICVVQLSPIKGDIEININKHKDVILSAVTHGADAIFFPELSLTGYEPELAKNLATTPEDIRLDVFQKLSDQHNITIGVGIPVRAAEGINISMICFQPGKKRICYSKQQLHADEKPYFVEGKDQLLLKVGNEKIAPAICYESLQKNHAEHAVELGATLYVASVAKSQNGIAKAEIHYPAVAAAFSIPVLLSNSVGFYDNFMSVGKSAVWLNNGTLSARLSEEQEALLMYNTDTKEVITVTL